MNEPENGTVPMAERRSSRWMAAFAFVILAARIGLSPLPLWKDWVIVVAACWFGTAMTGNAKVRALLAGIAAAYLLGLYVQGQWPHASSVWSPGP